MKREAEARGGAAAMNTPIAAMVIRMKRLPRRHRIAHLRALITQQAPGSIRWAGLVALLRDEMTLPCAKESRAG